MAEWSKAAVLKHEHRVPPVASCGNDEPSSPPEHSSHGSVPFQEPSAPFHDPVELALADAINRASQARRWEVVAQLARELEARRRAREADNVVSLTGLGIG